MLFPFGDNMFIGCIIHKKGGDGVQKNLLQLCYEGECGENYIRSMNEKGQIFVSLSDVLRTLSAENRKLDGKTSQSLLTVIRAVIKTLDPDEFRNVSLVVDGETISEVFLTEPVYIEYLLRILLLRGKNSNAGFFIRSFRLFVNLVYILRHLNKNVQN